MLKYLKHTALAAGLAVASSASFAADANTVVATVNGTDITVGHMIMVRAGLPEQYQNVPDGALWSGILDQLIQQTVLVQAGSDKQSKRVALALENEERALRAAETATDIIETAVSEKAILEAYQEAYGDGGGTEYNASHILVATEEEAANIADLARGGAEFASLAREHSTGPSGPNGGSLGWFGKGMMVAPFEEAVVNLNAGDISGPVQTQFGWHVIKLNESRIAEAPELDAVRAEISAKLEQDAVQGRITDLLKDAEITRIEATEIDPSILKNEMLLDH